MVAVIEHLVDPMAAMARIRHLLRPGGFVWQPERASEVTVQPSNTVVKSLHDLARLKTTSLHVEKVIDVRDHQKRLYGLLHTTAVAAAPRWRSHAPPGTRPPPTTAAPC